MEAHVDNRRLIFTRLDILHKELIDVHQYINECAFLEVVNHSKKLTSTAIVVVFPMFKLIVHANEKHITSYSNTEFIRFFNPEILKYISYTDFFKGMPIKKVDYERRLNAYRRKYYK